MFIRASCLPLKFQLNVDHKHSLMGIDNLVHAIHHLLWLNPTVKMLQKLYLSRMVCQFH